MIVMTLSEAATVMQGRLHGPDGNFRGCSTDSRQVAANQLFVALKGPSFDGHAYVEQAIAAGAAAVVVERPVAGVPSFIEVDGTLPALGRLASAWRARWSIPVIAITGSNGKTTVKEMTASVFRMRGDVLATRGNLNNEIGVPLTLCSLSAAAEAAVIEMGANAPGEIRRLTRMVQPTVGLVTLCASAHLEGFGSVEGVARAKGEIYEELPSAARAVLNVDDAFANQWRTAIGSRDVVSFGLERSATVTARGSAPLQLDVDGQRRDLNLPVPGRHNVMNALAAATAAFASDVDIDTIVRGLECFEPPPGRLQSKRAASGAKVLDDTYNANPSSVAAALAVLSEAQGERWLVMGDMAELGPAAKAFHREIGAAARAAGVTRLWAIGPLSRQAVEAFGRDGRHFSDRKSLIAALTPALCASSVVLVKGSRSAAMEHVVRALCDANRPEAPC